MAEQGVAETLLPRSSDGSSSVPTLKNAPASSAAALKNASASSAPALKNASALASATSPTTHRPANHPLVAARREDGALKGDFVVDHTAAPKNAAASTALASASPSAAPSPGRRAPDAVHRDADSTSASASRTPSPGRRAPDVVHRDAAPEGLPSASPSSTPSALGPAPSDADLLKNVLAPWVAAGENKAAGEVHEVDITSKEPDELARRYQPTVSGRGDRIWYFLSGLRRKGTSGLKHKERSVPGAGTWHAEGAAKDVVDPNGGHLLGDSIKLSFLRKGADGVRAKVRTGWVLNELHLHSAGIKVEDRVLYKMYKSNRRDGGAAKECGGNGETTGPKPGRKRIGAVPPARALKRVAAPVDYDDTPAFDKPAAASDNSPAASSSNWLRYCPSCGFNLGQCRP